MKTKVHMSTSKWRNLKKAFIRPFYSIGSKKKIVIILGCQRSGTTLLTNVLDRINYSKVFGEFSPISSKSDDKLRLNPIHDVVSTLNRNKAPLIIMKPLVESQNAIQLLNTIPNSNVIWLYRHYKDVVSSNKYKFKSTAGYKNIKPILEENNNNWRSENASKDTVARLRSLFDEKASDNDLGALFWYARNVLYYEQMLNHNENVTLWKYEDFVKCPELYISSLLEDVSLPKPSKNIYNIVSSSSVGRASDMVLREDIDKLCSDLMHNLNQDKTTLC